MSGDLVPAGARPAIARWTEEQIAMATRTFADGCDTKELEVFAEVSQRKRLDPWLGQIVAIKRGGKMIIQETVEGLRAIAERSGLYGGYAGPWWRAVDGDWLDVWLDPDNPPAAARILIYRKDWDQPAAGVAAWHSNVQFYKNRQGKPEIVPIWKDRPDEMLAKCAEVRALKRAFTKEFAAADISVRDLTDAQIVTVEARRAGLDDHDRHELVADVTGGRTDSTRDLTADETIAVRQEIARRAVQITAAGPGGTETFWYDPETGEHVDPPEHEDPARGEVNQHTADEPAASDPETPPSATSSPGPDAELPPTWAPPPMPEKAAGDRDDIAELKQRIRGGMTLKGWAGLVPWLTACGIEPDLDRISRARIGAIHAELDRRGVGPTETAP